jgi:hypothetical protein
MIVSRVNRKSLRNLKINGGRRRRRRRRRIKEIEKKWKQRIVEWKKRKRKVVTIIAS